ncbi:MAG: hypothetical protein QME61_02420 [Patescibacteria group bacterium]|nr:hypothetical protein [Patescibacteria group bacterium]
MKIRIFGLGSEMKEILEEAKELRVFLKEEEEIAVDNKEVLKEILKKGEITLEFLRAIFKGLKNINQVLGQRKRVSFPEKIVLFSKRVDLSKRVVFEDLTGAEIDIEKKSFKYYINLKDPRFEADLESKIQLIQVIYLLGLNYSLNPENISGIERIIKDSDIFQKIERDFFNEEAIETILESQPEIDREKVKEEIKRILEEIREDILLNSIELLAFIDAAAFPEYSPNLEEKLLKKSAKAKRDQIRKSNNSVEILFHLINLGMFFEEARILKNQKLQEKMEETVNKLKEKKYKEIFKEFRKIYWEVSEEKYLRELKEVEDWFIPEMTIEQKKKILKRALSEDFKKKIEEIDDEESFKEVLSSAVQAGLRIENIKKAEEQILKGE